MVQRFQPDHLYILSDRLKRLSMVPIDRTTISALFSCACSSRSFIVVSLFLKMLELHSSCKQRQIKLWSLRSMHLSSIMMASKHPILHATFTLVDCE
ncbi:hypothetical protein SCHPADRAFT_246280 [Schizopora paradoxa]|uniref:Uncharacterized protein n=1 Tax=Schizopora paradoxa TaxID=27342 RepID=A0A0H2RUY5_9AGAM|nr:hypothetical protein SCHPADRAFT_246280 [Schizopora paradoxa]